MDHASSVLCYILLNRSIFVFLHAESLLERWVQGRGPSSTPRSTEQALERKDATNQWIYMLGRTCTWILSAEAVLGSPLSPPLASAARALGVLLLAGGISLRLYAIRSLGSQWAFYVRPPGPTLVDSGAYRWCAHPSYWGNVWWLGLCLCLRGWLSFAVTALLLVGFTMARLRKERAVLAGAGAPIVPADGGEG